MEIDISALLDKDLSLVYGSVATHGKNAAKDTWEAANKVEIPLTNQQYARIYDHLVEMGIEKVSRYEPELRAYFVQLVAAELKDAELSCLSDLEGHRL